MWLIVFHNVIFIAAIGASSNPCMETYCGSSPESEIEVKNVANFIRMHKSDIKAYITIHSYSQLVLFPYSYTYDLAADHSELVGNLYTILLYCVYSWIIMTADFKCALFCLFVCSKLSE